MAENWSKRTKAVHGGTRRSQYGEMSEAIFLTQGFDYPSAEAAETRFIEAGPDEFIYARYGNPTVAMFEDRIAQIEGAEDAFATASGMAAVNGALTSMLKAGDHVVAARALFGSCLYILEEILPRFGVEVTLVDGTDLDQWRAALREDTRAVFFESVSNPTLEVIDVAAVADLAHGVGAAVVGDNVYMKHTGGSMSPFNAWVMLKGLETLSLRVNAQADTALAVCEAVQGHPALARAIYPGHPSHPQHALCLRQMGKGGTVVSLDLKGGKAAAFRFLDALRIARISNNLGDAKTIVTHPATTTHQRLPDGQKAALGITPGLVRVSLGLEETDDLIADFRQALDAAS